MRALLPRVRPTLCLDAAGLAAVSIGVGMWILPLGVIAAGLSAIIVSRLVDAPDARPGERT